MTRPAKLIVAILVTVTFASCGREGTPTGPSGQVWALDCVSLAQIPLPERLPADILKPLYVHH